MSPPEKVPTSDLPLIAALHTSGGMTQRELANVFCVGDSTIRNQLFRLEDMDIVQSAPKQVGAGKRWMISESIDEETGKRLERDLDAPYRKSQLDKHLTLGPSRIVDAAEAGLRKLISEQIYLWGTPVGWTYQHPRGFLTPPVLDSAPESVQQRWSDLAPKDRHDLSLSMRVDSETTGRMLLLLAWLHSADTENRIVQLAEEVEGNLEVRIEGAKRFLFAQFEEVDKGAGQAVRNPYLVFGGPVEPYFIDKEASYGHPLCPKMTGFVVAVLREAWRHGIVDLDDKEQTVLDEGLSFLRKHGQDYVEGPLEEYSFLGQMPLYGWSMILAGYRHGQRSVPSTTNLYLSEDWFADLLDIWEEFVPSGADPKGISTHRTEDHRSLEVSSAALLTMFDYWGFDLRPAELDELNLRPLAIRVASHIREFLPATRESTLHPSAPLQRAQALLHAGVYPLSSDLVVGALEQGVDWVENADAEQHFNQLAHAVGHLFRIHRVLDRFFDADNPSDYWAVDEFGAADRMKLLSQRLRW